MVSFNEMHGFFYEFPDTLSATVCYCITAVAEFLIPGGGGGGLFSRLWHMIVVPARQGT
jgi:hypothetical protein